MFPVNNDDLNTVGKLWSMVERGGMSFLLFLATIFGAYLFRSVLRTGADDLRKQNEEINTAVHNIEGKLANLKGDCVTCHQALVQELRTQREGSEERHTMLKEFLLKDIQIIKDDLAENKELNKQIVSKQDQIATSAREKLKTINEDIKDLKRK